MIRLSGLERVGVAAMMLAVGLGLVARPGPADEAEAGVLLLLTSGILMIATIGAVCRGRNDRPRWLGFAASGWGYFWLACWYTRHQGPMPTVAWMPGPVGFPGDLPSLPPRVRIVHDGWALAFAILGGRLACRFAADLPDSLPARWRIRPLPALSGFAAMVGIALACWPANRQIAAGALFLLAWTLAGFCILVAILGPGQHRLTWIGAASFGLAYLVMAFSFLGSSELPTNHLLNALFRPAGPVAGDERFDDGLTDDEESRRVREAMERPLTLHFPGGTNLGIVLDRVQETVRPSLGKRLPVYPDMSRLWKGRKDLDRLHVSIDREEIPASEALRLCLAQVRLSYRVQSGYVRIIPDVYSPVPYKEDPAMIAGHSLLAMLAAAIGGLAATSVDAAFRTK